MGADVIIDDNRPAAFVDESARPGPAGLYVVAAVVVHENLAVARVAAEKVPPSGKRFHWKDEREPSRLAMLDVLVGQGFVLRSYEAHPCATNRQGRARAKSLELLLWDLRQESVGQLVTESRGAPADRHDSKTVVNAIKADVAAPDLVYVHRRPREEPVLWLPDAVAGAAATGLIGQGHYRDRLGAALDRRHVVI